MADWTIKDLLDWITGHLASRQVDSPRLCAELLLARVLSTSRLELYTGFDRVVGAGDLKRLRDLVKRAAEHEPVQYLVGYTEFYALPIQVSCDCLIPRPETELLVDKAIEFLKGGGDGPKLVLDLCTGSGCIAVAVAKNCSDATVVATDCSEQALAVARRNVQQYGLGGRVRLLVGDLFEPMPRNGRDCLFNLIVCNPPYVPTQELDKLDRNVRDYEPRSALDGGPDGLDIIRRIVRDSGAFLRKDGALMLEVGYLQSAGVCDLIRRTGQFAQVRTYKDCHGIDRVVVGTRGGPGQHAGWTCLQVQQEVQ